MTVTIKTISLIAVLVGMAGHTFATPMLLKKHQNIEEYKLDNGLRIIVAPLAKEKTVVMKMTYFTGSLNDPDGKNGVAHVLEHFADKGTQQVSAEQFQQQIKQLPQRHLASTDYFSSSYLNILEPDSKALSQLLYLEAERMRQLQIKEEFLASELSLIQRELQISLDQPGTILRHQIFNSMYGHYDLARLPMGDRQELQSINIQDIQQYYDTWYAPNNALLMIAGKFDKELLLKQVEQYFTDIPAKAVPEVAAMAPFDANRIKQRSFSVEKGKGFLQCNFYLNHASEAPQIMYSLIPYLYSQQASGKLYRDIVTKKIASDVFVDLWMLPDANQMITLGAAYTPKHNANKVRDALIQSVERQPKFTSHQLQRARTALELNIKNYMNNAREVTNLVSDTLLLYQGQWDRLFIEKEQLNQLTTDELNRYLSQIFVPEKRMACELHPATSKSSPAMLPEATSVQPVVAEKHPDTAEQSTVKKEEQMDPQQDPQSVQKIVVLDDSKKVETKQQANEKTQGDSKAEVKEGLSAGEKDGIKDVPPENDSELKQQSSAPVASKEYTTTENVTEEKMTSQDNPNQSLEQPEDAEIKHQQGEAQPSQTNTTESTQPPQLD